ncbi:MAG: AmmeMemoRadiSam system protein B [Patescibacteria group bacterium]
MLGQPTGFNWRLILPLALIGISAAVPWSATGTPTAANYADRSGRVETPVNRAATTDLIASRPEFFPRNDFSAAIAAVDDVDTATNIRAVLVPHHLPASSLIADALQRAAGRDISTVVIIGPNHEELGPSVLTTSAAWETPFGRVEADSALISGLADNLLASSNAEGFRAEHSIGAIVPFVRHYVPTARILPLILRYDTGDEIDALAAWLHANLPAETLIVYSVDFSHYLSENQADRNDEHTKRLLLDNRRAELLHLNSDFIDSPAAVALALRLAELDDSVLTIQQHANSNRFIAQPSSSTTGFFEIIWSSKP